jgi:protein-S-isoprenylcysteine O-methyltransferase Ste14
MLFIFLIFWTIFILNYCSKIFDLYLIHKKSKKSETISNKLYNFIWIFSSVGFILMSSSFQNDISFLKGFWIYFVFIGFAFLIYGIKINVSLSKFSQQIKGADVESRFNKKGPFQLMRHPVYASLTFIYAGGALIFDSFIGILLWPFICFAMALLGYLRERFLLIPRFKEEYIVYRQKVTKLLYPNPLNYILILIGAIIFYIGFIGFL